MKAPQPGCRIKYSATMRVLDRATVSEAALDAARQARDGNGCSKCAGPVGDRSRLEISRNGSNVELMVWCEACQRAVALDGALKEADAGRLADIAKAADPATWRGNIAGLWVKAFAAEKAWREALAAMYGALHEQRAMAAEAGSEGLASGLLRCPGRVRAFRSACARYAYPYASYARRADLSSVGLLRCSERCHGHGFSFSHL